MPAGGGSRMPPGAAAAAAARPAATHTPSFSTPRPHVIHAAPGGNTRPAETAVRPRRRMPAPTALDMPARRPSGIGRNTANRPAVAESPSVGQPPEASTTVRIRRQPAQRRRTARTSATTASTSTARTTSSGRRMAIGTAATGITAIGTATGTTPGIIGRWAGGRPATGPAPRFPRFPGPGDIGRTTTPTMSGPVVDGGVTIDYSQPIVVAQPAAVQPAPRRV